MIAKPHFKHRHSSYVCFERHDSFESIIIPVFQEVELPA